MRMPFVIQARGEVTIDASPEAVFDYLADARNEPQWLPGAKSVTKVTEGDVGLHTRFDGEYARAGKVAVELVEFERPRKLTFRAKARIVEFDDIVELAPHGRATRLTARMIAQPRGVMKLFTPLMAKTMQRQFAANWAHLRVPREKQ